MILSPTEGPTQLKAQGVSVPLHHIRVVRADHGVRVALGDGGPQIDLIEHLSAALGGLGVHGGVTIEVIGGEVPLLDGGSRVFVDALCRLNLVPTLAPVRIRKPYRFVYRDSFYELAPHEGHESIRLDVEIAFAHPLIGSQRAQWLGDPSDFVARIAPARTFGFLRDQGALRAEGRAAWVDPSSVLVFDDHDVARGCALPTNEEPVRHKLLDLIGDLALYGGPPIGIIHAVRPGHQATHAMMGVALAEGVIGPAGFLFIP